MSNGERLFDASRKLVQAADLFEQAEGLLFEAQELLTEVGYHGQAIEVKRMAASLKPGLARRLAATFGRLARGVPL